MTGTVVIGIEGMLAQAGRVPIVQRQIDPEARKFYAHLLAGYRVVLLTEEEVLATDKVRWWLQSVGVTGYDDLVMAPPGAEDLVGIRYRQVTGLRAARTDVALLIDGDPLVVTMGAQQGITSLLWLRARPALMRGDLALRPIRSWDSIVDEVENQRTFVGGEQ